MSASHKEHQPARPVAWARLLLLVPIVAVLWVPFYNGVEPSWAGIPFFYWYQMLWIIIGAATIVLVYKLEH
jgi:hypothetical protein